MPNTVYVCDLDPAATELQLWDVFNQVGYVASVRVCRDTATGLSLGFGYVNYVDGEAAARAVSQLNLGNIAGKPCRVMCSSCCIYVSNLPPGVDNNTLLTHFTSHSLSPKSAVVALGPQGISLGFGFVEFISGLDAKTAIKEKNGSTLNGKELFVQTTVRKTKV